MITYTMATHAHGEQVSAHLRTLDREELRLSGASDVHRAIRTSIDLSHGGAVAALADGEAIAVFGVSPNYLLGEGVPWMLGTDEVARHPRELVRWSRRMTAKWLEEFPILLNEVWVGNRPATTFLRHAGFSFAEPRVNEYGAGMALFYMRRS